MAWWTLKDKNELDSYECLKISEENVLDFVILSDDTKGVDDALKKIIFNQIRNGNTVANIYTSDLEPPVEMSH